MWTGGPGFVPEGLDEGSLAVHCQECVYKKDPSRRARSEFVYSHVHQSRLRKVPADAFIPFPTGRVRFLASPGSKLPGYHQLVPSGQKAFLRPVRKIDSTSLHTAGVEDEDEDEYENDSVLNYCRHLSISAISSSVSVGNERPAYSSSTWAGRLAPIRTEVICGWRRIQVTAN